MDLLIFIEGAQKGQRYPLEGKKITLGRDRKNTIPLDDSGSSRNHATILKTNKGLVIQDSGSTNGTYLNSRRLKKDTLLSHGDRIVIGDSVMLIERAPTMEVPRVVVSDVGHDTTGDITLKMDSTVFLSPDLMAAVEARTKNLVQALFEFMTKISGALDMERLLPMALSEMVKAVSADRGAILFVSKADELIPRVCFPEAGTEVTVSRTITDNVLKTRQGILSNPGGKNAQLRNTVSITKRDVGSIICTPLTSEDNILGVVYLDTLKTAQPFTEESLRIASAMSMQLAISIQNANLYRSLRNSEEFGSCILKSMPSGLMIVDGRGVVVRCNESACQILSIEQKELVGVPLGTMESLSEIGTMVEQTRKSGIPMDRTEVMVNIAGRQVPLGISTSILEDFASRTTGVVCTFRDLTRMKKLADAVKRSQRLASLGEMAAGIAHEIRNPLNSVFGFVQLLEEGAKERGSSQDMEYSQIVLEEVERINRIVQDMLDFSKQREVTMTSIALIGFVQDILGQLKADKVTNGLEIGLEVIEDARPVILGNADKLKQMMLNILQNACQACEPGGKVTVRIKVSRDTSQVYNEAAVLITDTGRGMSRENVDKIFNPFFTTKDVGTGLGLSICQKIAEQHSGRIEVESVEGEGSTFSIFFPMRS